MPLKSPRLAMLGVFLLALVMARPAAAGGICSRGDSLQVLWHGTWYPAHALKAGNGKCFIRYDGYDSSWDEWVGPDRLKNLGKTPLDMHGPWKGGEFYHKGDKVLVLWRYLWYRATVLKVKGARLFIHYDGWRDNWDEWVGPKRVKIRDPEGQTKPAE